MFEVSKMALVFSGKFEIIVLYDNFLFIYVHLLICIDNTLYYDTLKNYNINFFILKKS